MKAILYYVHDPMCSWCWGFSRVLSELVNNLPKEIEVRRLLGGLASDSDTPMPEAMKDEIKNNWLNIEEKINGVKFNFDFWEKTIPRRSTYPACRAVIAARQQGEKFDILMTKAIQHAYYKEARNPSDDSTLIAIAKEVDLDTILFTKAYFSDIVNKKLMQEIEKSRELYVQSYPSLILRKAKKFHNIQLDYNVPEVMLEQIFSLV